MRFPSRCVVLVLTAGAVFTACGPGESTEDAGVTQVDSAGVTIKEYAPPTDWTAPLTLTEITRIGTLDGPPPTLFSSIPGGRILDDGTIVVLDRGSHEVRQFSTDGQHLRSHGREGEGPGEYEFILGVGQCAATGFTVFDFGWTLSHYDQNGEFLREQTTRLDGGTTPYLLACDTSGRLAVLTWDRSLPAGGPTPGFHTAMANMHILRPEGASALDLGERIGSEQWGTASQMGPHPAGRAAKFGFSGTDLIVSDGSFFGFERWDTAGRLIEITRVGGVPHPDSDSLMSEYMDWAMARATSDDQRTAWRQHVSEMEAAEKAAYFNDLFVSDEGVLLRELGFEGSGRWFAFDRDGRPQGYLPLPPATRLLDLRDGLLRVSERDEMGVQTAVLYEVR